MSLGPFYVGQIPSESWQITVRNASTRSALDLSDYTIDLLLTGPDDVAISTADGSASVVGGVFNFSWPPYSLFNSVGKYSYQLHLTAEGIDDYTTIANFHVKEHL